MTITRKPIYSMNKSLYTIAVAVGSLLMATDVNAQNLLPKPQTFKAGKGYFSTSTPTVKIVNEAGTDAENIYTRSWHQTNSDAAKQTIKFVKLQNASSPEAYRLHITADSIVVSAASADAFRYAWQTIGQLKTKQGIMACDIDDAPAYKWRSIMLDVSRHFEPISFIKKQIDVMAQYKFNRLHLHLTDAAGWRIEIKRYPLLTRMAAWRPERTWKEWSKNGAKYTMEGSADAHGIRPIATLPSRQSNL